MGALTEIEIFSCMSDNLRAAAQHAEDLALKPAQGPTYWNFREEMLLVEGCCRQASVWRQDTRWLNIGMMVAEALKHTGKWLRGYKVEGRAGKTLYSRDLYLKLSANLRGIMTIVEQVRHAATGTIGMILPEIAHQTRTQGRAVQVMTPGGILLPA